MEELIELFQTQFGIDSLSFIFLIEQIHLKLNKALSIALDQGISSGN